MASMIRAAYLDKLVNGVMSLYRYDFQQDIVYSLLDRYDTRRLGKMVEEMKTSGTESILKYLD